MLPEAEGVVDGGYEGCGMRVVFWSDLLWSGQLCLVLFGLLFVWSSLVFSGCCVLFCSILVHSGPCWCVSRVLRRVRNCLKASKVIGRSNWPAVVLDQVGVLQITGVGAKGVGRSGSLRSAVGGIVSAASRTLQVGCSVVSLRINRGRSGRKVSQEMCKRLAHRRTGREEERAVGTWVLRCRLPGRFFLPVGEETPNKSLHLEGLGCVGQFVPASDGFQSFATICVSVGCS